MSLKNYVKTEIQEDLNKLLLKIQKELKKKMFPRKHRKLLVQDVIISIDDLEAPTAGRYETIKDEKINIDIFIK